MSKSIGGIKRHHSIEDFQPLKEAKVEESENQDELLEKGDIVFMYKPKLGVDEAKSNDDVQLFHILLKPIEQQGKIRLIKIGKKKLPNEKKDRFWAFIEKAEEEMDNVEDNLEAKSYQTTTGGTRTVKSDRIAGKGKYLLVKHDQRQTILGYVLESPSEIGEVQNAFHINKEASFSLSVKNPKTKSPPATGLTQSQKAIFPDEIQEKFGSYQWLPAEPDMLDIPGCEMIWIGHSTDDLEDVLGELGREIEDEVDPDKTATEVMKEIQLDEKEHPIQPLIDGQWPSEENAPEKKES